MTQPTDYNASLGERVTFNCSISLWGDFNWLLNGNELIDYSNLGRQAAFESTSLRSTLYITALDINNNVQITCVAEINGMVMYTNAVTLRVQGNFFFIHLILFPSILYRCS